MMVLVLVGCAAVEPPEGFLMTCDSGRPCPEDLVCGEAGALFSGACTIRCDHDSDCRIEGHDDWYCIDAIAGRPAVCVPDVPHE